jgi:cbb3-type cytochrome c oxidase subunit III
VLFHRLVRGVQGLTVAACVATVLMLVVYDPPVPTVDLAADGGGMTLTEQGAAIYEVHCTGCHGADGTGGYGPSLAGPELLERYPEPADEAAFIAEGSAGMQPFADVLTTAELDAVVAFTRALAGETGVATTGTIDPDEAAAGAAVYADVCAGCHGADGEGGFGPAFAGGAAVERFPDEADQVAVVNEGRNAMPGYEGELTAEEIAAVVAYTRALP